jgi:hypothetical protein
MTPKRIQRKRTGGWRMPDNAIYVGRPTKWGNPFVMQDKETREDVVQAYANLIDPATATLIRQELRGKDLACWCPLDQPCHADVLLEIANSDSVRHTDVSITRNLKFSQ